MNDVESDEFPSRPQDSSLGAAINLVQHLSLERLICSLKKKVVQHAGGETRAVCLGLVCVCVSVTVLSLIHI